MPVTHQNEFGGICNGYSRLILMGVLGASPRNVIGVDISTPCTLLCLLHRSKNGKVVFI